MSLWVLRVAILDAGPWQAVREQRNLERLMNSPRKRTPAQPPALLTRDFLF